MFGVKETDNGGPKGVVDEQTASSSPLWVLRGNWVIVQTVCQKGPGQTAVWIWELLAVRHQCSTVQPKQEVYAHVRAKKGHVLSQRFAKNMKKKKMARRVPISKKFSAPKPLFTAKHRGNDLYSGALRCAVCFMSSAAALPYKTGERRRAGFWRGGLRELDTNRSGGLKGLNSPFKKTAVRLLGSSHCQNREVVLPTSVFIFMCVTECGSNMDAKNKYKN